VVEPVSSEYRLFIDGAWCEAAAGKTLGVVDPALGEVFAEAALAGREDAKRAIAAAERAFGAWSRRIVYERAEPVRRVAELLRERVDLIARLLTREVGKPLSEAKGEVLGAAAVWEWSAEEAKRAAGEWMPSHVAGKRMLTMRMPVGVVGAIAPWNFPVLLISRKLAPALAVGCTVIAKPASKTPLATVELFRCIEQAGFPAGAANLVIGPPGEVADEFMRNPAVRKVSFTGSVAVGKQLMAQAAPELKKLSLELGGHAPFIVAPDMPVAEAAATAVAAKFRNMGQVCISPSRFYVPEKIAEAFTAAAAQRAGELRLGPGLEPETQVGPLVDEERVQASEALVADIEQRDGAIVCGGRRPRGEKYRKGSYFEPTVATGISREMRIMQEEPFAPILPVLRYRGLEDAVREANDTPYGLAAYVLTHDLGTAFRLGEALEAGIISVNDISPSAAQLPFGGMKQSGLGREGGRYGLEAYTEVKYMSIGL
jgi:succinate-semialdehyde dehydrogenase/glutarate-semialdehyde dehydrogenase